MKRIYFLLLLLICYSTPLSAQIRSINYSGATVYESNSNQYYVLSDTSLAVFDATTLNLFSRRHLTNRIVKPRLYISPVSHDVYTSSCSGFYKVSDGVNLDLLPIVLAETFPPNPNWVNCVDGFRVNPFDERQMLVSIGTYAPGWTVNEWNLVKKETYLLYSGAIVGSPNTSINLDYVQFLEYNRLAALDYSSRQLDYYILNLSTGFNLQNSLTNYAGLALSSIYNPILLISDNLTIHPLTGKVANLETGDAKPQFQFPTHINTSLNNESAITNLNNANCEKVGDRLYCLRVSEYYGVVVYLVEAFDFASRKKLGTVPLPFSTAPIFTTYQDGTIFNIGYNQELIVRVSNRVYFIQNPFLGSFASLQFKSSLASLPHREQVVIDHRTPQYKIARPILVYNRGNAPLVIDSVTVGNAMKRSEVSINANQFVIAPADSQWVTLHYSPKTAGTFNTPIYFHTNGITKKDSIWFYMQTKLADFNVAIPNNDYYNSLLVVDSLDLGLSRFGEARDEALYLVNSSYEEHTALMVNEVSVNHPSFKVRGAFPFLAPSTSSYNTLSFTPTAYGTHNAEISFVSNAPLKQTFKLKVHTQVVKAPRVKITPTYLTWYDAELNRESMKTIVFANTGDDTLRVTSIGSNDFRLEPALVIVPPNTNLQVKLFHTPKQSGLNRYYLECEGNFFEGAIAANEKKIQIEVIGGTTYSPKIEVQPNFVSLSSMDTRQTHTRVLRVYNRGVDSLFVNGFMISGSEGSTRSTITVEPDSFFVKGGEFKEVLMSYRPRTEADKFVSTYFVSNAQGGDSSFSIVLDQLNIVNTETDVTQPNTTELLPTFPNPFGDKVTVRYQLKQDATVKAALYSILGNKVMDVVQESQQQQGTHQIDLDGQHLSNGVYVLYFEIDGVSFRQLLHRLN